MFIPSGCKDKGIKKFEFVKKTQSFIYLLPWICRTEGEKKQKN